MSNKVNSLPLGQVVVNIDFSVKQGKEEEFLKLVYYLIDNSLKEEGNISYRVFREERATDKYEIIEHWESQDALNAHLSMPHVTYYNENVGQYLTEDANRIELVTDKDSIQ